MRQILYSNHGVIKFNKSLHRGRYDVVVVFQLYISQSLVTQPRLQLTPNQTELRSMDLYNQIFCRFQKCNQKVPPPSLPCRRKKKLHLSFSGRNFFLGWLLGQPYQPKRSTSQKLVEKDKKVLAIKILYQNLKKSTCKHHCRHFFVGSSDVWVNRAGLFSGPQKVLGTRA